MNGWAGPVTLLFSAGTAAQNEDVYRFFRKWLADLAIGQAADGGVPHIVPNVNGQGSGGAAVWCDAAVTIPWISTSFTANGIFWNGNTPA